MHGNSNKKKKERERHMLSTDSTVLR